jgi:LPXTG-motif cell wall-anchored protein
MDKKIMLLSIIAIGSFTVKADTPGKAKMHESKVSFQDVKKIPGYTFYWKQEGKDNYDSVTSDSSLILASSGGAPYRYLFWGINNTSKKSTDTILFDNYYAPDYVVIVNDVKQDSIYYTTIELSNANKIVTGSNTGSVANKQLVADAKKATQNHYTKIILFSLAGIAALAGLILYFIRRKKKKLPVV